MSEKLSNPKLTLDSAKTMVRQKAAVKDQQCELQVQGAKEAALGRIHHFGHKSLTSIKAEV